MSGPRGCLFSPDKLGVLLTHAGNRWKLWRENEAAVEVSHDDKSESYSAALWTTSKDSQILVLGCSSGRVQAWDPSSSELIGPTAEAFRTIAQGSDCAISGLASSSYKRGTVFAACLGSPEILEVGLADGTTRGSFRAAKDGICRLAATTFGTHGEWLLAASPGSVLKLWKLPGAGATFDSQKAQFKLSAPTNPATSLDLWSHNSRLLALSADGTMQIDLFDLDAAEESKSKQPKPSARVLSCHERLQRASFGRNCSTGGRLVVVGFSNSIIACWSLEAFTGRTESGPRTVAPTFTISQSELGGKVLAARTATPASVSDPLALIVSYGPFARPVFAQVQAPNSKGSSTVVVPIAGQVSLASKAGNKIAGETTAAKAQVPIVLGPAEFAAKKPGKRTLEEATPAQKRPKMPMPGSRPVTAGSNLSLAPILRQGLRAKDSNSLDKCMRISDRELVATSVAELSGAEAFDLLQESAKKLIEKPMEGQVYCMWIQKVLVHHCSFISSQPALQAALQPLHDASTVRCASYRGLGRLHGRLHHLVSCGKEVLERKAQELATRREPLLQYVEGDEDLGDDSPDEDEEAAKDEDEDDLDEDEDLDGDWFDSEDED